MVDIENKKGNQLVSREENYKPVSVLIVEDSPTQAEKLKYFLEEEGYQVILACNGKQALLSLKTVTPILIISDIVMPEMDGYELCRTIKADKKLNEIPVILLTAMNEPEYIVKGLQCGADHFLTKPYEKDNLLSHIQYVLSNRELRRKQKMGITLDFIIGGKEYSVTSDRMQLLDCLISTYETAFQQNKELVEAKEELRQLNLGLEETVQQRVKELTCVYTIDMLGARGEFAIDELCQKVVDLIPSSWRYPEITEARITLRNKKFETKNYKDTQWSQNSPIQTLEGNIGEVKVVYLEERPELGRGPFSREERKLINSVAQQVSRITESKEANGALKISELRYRRLFESAKDGILILDADTGLIIDVNPFMVEMLGYAADKFVGKQLWDIGFFKDVIANRANFIKLRKEKYVRYENLQLETAEGRGKDVEFVSNVYDVGDKEIIQCNIRDITERKEAEKKIESLARFPSENPSPVFRSNRKGLLQYANASAQTLLDNWKTTIGKVVPQNILEVILDALNSGLVKTIENKVGDRTFILTIAPVMEADYTNVYGLEITKRKQAEEELKWERDFSNSVVQTAQTIILSLDKQGMIVFFNKYLEEISGYRLEEVRGKSWFDTFLPDRDRAMIRLLFERDFSSGIQTQGNVNQIITKDGRELDIEWYDKTMKDASGNITGLLCIGQDITNRKKMEENLRYQANLLENVSDAVIATDIQYNIQFWNKMAEKQYGWTASEVIGHPLETFIINDYLGGSLDSILQSISQSGYWKGEVTQNRRDGVRIPILTTLSSVTNEAKQTIGFVTINRDITERKRAEQELMISFEGIVNTISATCEMRDPYTAGHQQRVAQLCITIAEELHLSYRDKEGLRVAALVHDIGKMSIPAEILSKPGNLNSIEHNLVKMHVQAGYDILKGIDFPWPIAQIVCQHHERMDGSGYPNALKGEDIRIEARILIIADVVESMTSHRPYRPALGIEKALLEISNNRGKLYDADVVDTCLTVFRDKEFEFE